VGHFQVDPAVLAAVVDRMAAFEQNLKKTLDRVAAQERSLGADWAGSLADSQREAQRRWAEGAAEMREALTDLRRITHGAQKNYHAAAQTNTQNWR
jgi:WXG100 family type VII secretion target